MLLHNIVRRWMGKRFGGILKAGSAKEGRGDGLRVDILEF